MLMMVPLHCGLQMEGDVDLVAPACAVHPSLHCICMCCSSMLTLVRVHSGVQMEGHVDHDAPACVVSPSLHMHVVDPC